MKNKIKLKCGRVMWYSNLHNELRKIYGPPIMCEFCDGGMAKRYEWALKSGRIYSLDIEDYLQLCPSCHRKYDFTEEQREAMSKRRKGKPAHNKCAVINSNGDIYNSITEASQAVGVVKSAIINNLNGLSSSAAGLQWERI